MRQKQKALLNDLSRVLRKYNADDWTPVIRLLTSRPALLIEALAEQDQKSKRKSAKGSAKKSKSRKSAKKSTKARVTRTTVTRTGSRTGPTEKERELTVEQLLHDARIGQLRSLYSEAYKQKDAPESRVYLVTALKIYFRALPEEGRKAFIEHLTGPSGYSSDEINRWVKVIAKR